MPGMTGSIAAAPPGVLEKCSALVVSPTSVRTSRFAGLSHVLDACCGRPKRCRRPRAKARAQRRWALPGEGHDVPMKVQLVGVAAFCRHNGGAVTRGEAASGVVETGQPGGALGVGPIWDRNEP
jgi:hypothetical protein